MKAAVCEKYGPPDVLEFKEVQKPIPGDNEILIRVHATTVNRTDNAYIKAIPSFARLVTGLLKPKYPIPGTEFAGEIVALGSAVTQFEVGDRVFGFNDRTYGAQAQYMTVSEDGALTTMPEDCTYEQAAASSEGAFYALNFINKVKIESGQKILVNGATGAIGSAIVQLLQSHDVDVTAVCDTKNMELVRSLGAKRVIDYTKEDFTKEDFTKEDQKYHFVFDAIGKSSFFKCRSLLQRGGVYISSDLGFMGQNIFLPLITPILKPMIESKKTVFPIPTDAKGCILFIKKLMEQDKFNAVIDRKYPLKQIVEAYRYVEKGQKTGNVVITVQHDETVQYDEPVQHDETVEYDEPEHIGDLP